MPTMNEALRHIQQPVTAWGRRNGCPRVLERMDSDWEEDEHPREKGGKFTHKGQGEAPAQEAPKPAATSSATVPAPQAATPPPEAQAPEPGSLASPTRDKNGVPYGVKDGWPWDRPAPSVEATLMRYPPANADGNDTQKKYKRADKTYTPERQQLHDEIVAGYLAKARPVDPGAHPTYLFMGGGTASGKSYITENHLIELPENAAKVDPDELKGMLPEYQRMAEDRNDKSAAFVHEESSDLAKRITEELLAMRSNVVMDVTGDNRVESVIKKTSQARAAGQRVVANYVTVDVDKALEFAAKRAKKPPYRNVGDARLIKIHASVSRVFGEAVVANCFDEFTLWDNNGGKPVRIASGHGSDMQVHDPVLWKRFLAKRTAYDEYCRAHPEHDPKALED